MGEKGRNTKAKLAEISKANGWLKPFCIFCSGVNTAVEVEHIPPRSLFLDRVSAADFEFPSCLACNRSSRIDDLLVAFIAHCTKGDDVVTDKLKKLMGGIANNAPGLLERSYPRAIDARRLLRRLDIKREPGESLSDVPMLVLSDERWQGAFAAFTVKLTKALFWFHTKRIFIDCRHEMISKFFTNVNMMESDLIVRIGSALPGLVLPSRGRRDLSEQFAYRFDYNCDAEIALFAAKFGTGFAIVSLVNPKSMFDASNSLRHVNAVFDET